MILQAFLTKEALEQISTTTITNIKDFVSGTESKNEVKPIPKLKNSDSFKGSAAK